MIQARGLGKKGGRRLVKVRWRRRNAYLSASTNPKHSFIISPKHISVTSKLLAGSGF